MTEPPAPKAPLSVETDLELTIDGTDVDVQSTGDRLFVEFPSLSGVVHAARTVPRSRTEEVTATLTATALTVEVRSRGRTIAALGADAPAGPVSRWLGIAPAQIRVGGLAGAVSEELSAGARALRELLG
ncbi:hypothetical protein [Salinibaculum rarum]|uniref:hypothetical protein n=1 Tax=Salinibaculum rarum TaxID=3058903 RepID=UPI00265E97FC|nr:hypothetical protein [Salinibaculum sp. KK48]